MPYCTYIDNGFCIDPSGWVSPCCHIKGPNFNEVHISEFNWDDSFPELREQMKNGWAKACEVCRLDEEYHGDSARTKHPPRLELKGKKTIFDLQVTNTCNLACRMCTPGQSSTWNKLIKDNPDFPWRQVNDRLSPVTTSTSWHSEFLHQIKNRMDDCEWIQFTGGEPFMVKQVKQVCLDIIASGNAHATEVKFITNGQVELTDDWFDILPQFKHVNMDISIDGVGSRYEYIRLGSEWNKIETFIKTLRKKCPGIDISASFLPQTLNIGNLSASLEWAKSMNLYLYHTAYYQLEEPAFMNFSSLSPTLREKFNVQTETPYVEGNFEKLVKYMEALDKIHGTDMRQECPELFEKY